MNIKIVRNRVGLLELACQDEFYMAYLTEEELNKLKEIYDSNRF